MTTVAKEAREAFLTADKRLRDIVQEIERLKEDLERDYGPEERFRVLKESCFEYSDQEYTYKLCPFNSVCLSLFITTLPILKINIYCSTDNIELISTLIISY